MEIGWAFLLCLALADSQTRPLAFLLALKWAANYLGFIYVAEWMPAFTDVLFATVGIWMLERHYDRWWAIILIVGFVLTPLFHAWFWINHDAGTATTVIALTYYHAVLWTFTAMVAALSWRGGRNCVEFVRGVVQHRRRCVAGGAGHCCGPFACSARRDRRKGG